MSRLVQSRVALAWPDNRSRSRSGGRGRGREAGFWRESEWSGLRGHRVVRRLIGDGFVALPVAARGTAGLRRACEFSDRGCQLGPEVGMIRLVIGKDLVDASYQAAGIGESVRGLLGQEMFEYQALDLYRNSIVEGSQGDRWFLDDSLEQGVGSGSPMW